MKGNAFRNKMRPHKLRGPAVFPRRGAYLKGMEQRQAMLGRVSATEQKSLDKAARTTRAATEIIEKEAAASVRKTNRLRELRMTREAAAPPAAPKPRKRAVKAR